MNYQTKTYNKKQYENSDNLKKRIGIYKYNSNKENWCNWVYKQIPIEPNMKILELGCGTGALWKDNFNSIPENTKVTLTDLNPGMLESCKENLKYFRKEINFQIVNIEKLPYSNDTFDIIIANHVLYHLTDINKGLSEVKRVLKDNGTFITTTIGLEDNKELKQIFHNYNKSIPFYPEKIAKLFGLENGEPVLKRHFKKIIKNEYVNHLEIPETDSILTYAESITGFNDIVKNKEEFKKYLNNELIIQNGKIRISKSTCIFICNNSRQNN